jgi:VTC domain
MTTIAAKSNGLLSRLARRAEISSLELEGGREDARYEMKLVTQGMAYRRVLTELRLHRCALRTLHPSRRVQSVYLDTHDGRALEENLAGASDREKVRFRWYGDETGCVRGALERKIRRNMLGWKETFQYSGDIRVGGASRLAFMRSLIQGASTAFGPVLSEGLEPAQWISYTRDYLTTADGSLRVTIDHNVRCADQRNRATLSMRYTTPTPNMTIIECKAAQDRYDALRNLLNTLPLVIDKCSKFVIASDPPSAPIVSVLPD